ncbi:MAG: hypothetical protein CMP20_10395 [Rickettsiales bacterium]|nr:hypothetical protein [Rickettsiales bacterium]
MSATNERKRKAKEPLKADNDDLKKAKLLESEPADVIERVGDNARVFAIALGFLLEHCRGFGFSRAFKPINRSMSDLVVLLSRDYSEDKSAQRIQYACRVMLCVLAQGIQDEGSVAFDEFGVTLDEVWALFPFEIESREHPLAKLRSGELLSLLRSFSSINEDINGSGRYDSYATYEREWDQFVVQFRESVFKQMKRRKKQLKRTVLDDLSKNDLKMLEVLSSKNKKFGLGYYD